tara:strand:+ start:2012 stop:3571 length:1560 start_codon:yes stop_codon:yes gene_type:complete
MSSSRFNKLTGERELFLNRARECSKLTLPLVVRDRGDSSSTDYETPFQSVGSRGVNNLASELLLSLFPSNVPFFRLLVSENAFEGYGEQAPQIKAEVEGSLAMIEQTILEELEDKNLRPSIFESLKSMLISGNALVYVQPDGNLRSYSLEDYVIKRDIEGSVLEIIVRESINKQIIESMGITLPSDSNEDKDDENIELHTCIELEDSQYKVYQSIKGEEIESTKEYYAAEKLPWLALRLTKVTGESYGRSYVEGHIGDLKSLEGLQKALVESAAIMSKVVFMVNPASTTRARSIASARNGDVINGNASDVTTLQAGKSSDMSVAFEATRTLERRLSYAFNLLDASLPTSGRTTATEIQAIVNSLEKVMAGTYAMLSSEFIRPLVRAIIDRLSTEGKIPALPEEVKLIISVGISSLGRSSDIERLQQFSMMAQQFAPQAYGTMANQGVILRELQRAVGVKESVVKSNDQLQQEQQQAMMAEQQQMQQQQAMMQEQQKGKLIEKVAPQLVKQMQEPQQEAQ